MDVTWPYLRQRERDFVCGSRKQWQPPSGQNVKSVRIYLTSPTGTTKDETLSLYHKFVFYLILSYIFFTSAACYQIFYQIVQAITIM